MAEHTEHTEAQNGFMPEWRLLGGVQMKDAEEVNLSKLPETLSGRLWCKPVVARIELVQALPHLVVMWIGRVAEEALKGEAPNLWLQTTQKLCPADECLGEVLGYLWLFGYRGEWTTQETAAVEPGNHLRGNLLRELAWPKALVFPDAGLWEVNLGEGGVGQPMPLEELSEDIPAEEVLEAARDILLAEVQAQVIAFAMKTLAAVARATGMSPEQMN